MLWKSKPPTPICVLFGQECFLRIPFSLCGDMSDLTSHKRQSIQSWCYEVGKHMRDGSMCQVVVAEVDPKSHDTLSVFRPLVRTHSNHIQTNTVLFDAQGNTKDVTPKTSQSEEQRRIVERLFSGMSYYETDVSKRARRNLDSEQTSTVPKRNLNYVARDHTHPVVNVDPQLALRLNHGNSNTRERLIHVQDSSKDGPLTSRMIISRTTSKASTYQSSKNDNTDINKSRHRHSFNKVDTRTSLFNAATGPQSSTMVVPTASRRTVTYNPLYKPNVITPNSYIFNHHQSTQLPTSVLG